MDSAGERGGGESSVLWTEGTPFVDPKMGRKNVMFQKLLETSTGGEGRQVK